MERKAKARVQSIDLEASLTGNEVALARDRGREGAFSDSVVCLSAMKIFLEHGADPNQISWCSEHPEESAISVSDYLDDRCHNFEEIYQSFLSLGAVVGFMDYTSTQYQRATHHDISQAVESEHEEC